MKVKTKKILLVLVIPGILLACSENPPTVNLSTASTSPIPEEKVQVYRTMMPDAGPSAFAVRFKESGLALCYDPVRGGVNYIWTGDFDLKPTVTGKISKLALVEGDPFYREKEWHPLRTSITVDQPDYQFGGYTLKEGLLEFWYTIDGGVRVKERITPVNEGIRRDFTVEGNGQGESLYLHMEPQDLARVSVEGGSLQDGGWAVIQGELGADFSVTIQKKKEVEK